METPAPDIQIKGTILLADDEKMVLDIGVQMLKRLGFNVIAVESGKKAVEAFQEKNDSIDLVILDLVMPDLGGAEVVDAIKGINPDIKIMLSSGYGRDADTADLMQSCQAFIQKPFSMKDLTAALEDILQ